MSRYGHVFAELSVPKQAHGGSDSPSHSVLTHAVGRGNLGRRWVKEGSGEC